MWQSFKEEFSNSSRGAGNTLTYVYSIKYFDLGITFHWVCFKFTYMGNLK